MMTANAGNARARLVSKRRIGIDFAFVFSVIKQHRPADSRRIELDRDALGLALRWLFAGEASGYGLESVGHYKGKPQD